MAARGYREYDPEFTAAQLLSTVNGLGKNLFTVGDANLDFNNIVAQQDAYDLAGQKADEARRQSDYEDRISQGISDGTSLEDIQALKKKAAQELGMPDEYEQSLKAEEAKRNQQHLADIFDQSPDFNSALEQAKTELARAGRFDEAMKLKPDSPKQYKIGNQIVRETADGFIPVYTAPEKAKKGSEDSEINYINPDTLDIKQVSKKDAKGRADLGLDYTPLDHLSILDQIRIRAAKAKKAEDAAKQQDEQSISAPSGKSLIDQAKELASYIGSVPEAGYNKMIQAKPTVRRRVVMR